MSRAARRFVLWLIIAILPVQGYAAATMVACGPSHERMAARAPHAHAEDLGRASHHGAHDHAAHDHGAHAHAAHDHAGFTPDAHAAVTPDDTARAASDLASFTCSACAACCVGAALPAREFSLDVPAPAPDTLRPATAAPLTAVTLDGLERPPRPFLA
jgi:hypothetical protein